MSGVMSQQSTSSGGLRRNPRRNTKRDDGAAATRLGLRSRSGRVTRTSALSLAASSSDEDDSEADSSEHDEQPFEPKRNLRKRAAVPELSQATLPARTRRRALNDAKANRDNIGQESASGVTNGRTRSSGRLARIDEELGTRHRPGRPSRSATPSRASTGRKRTAKVPATPTRKTGTSHASRHKNLSTLWQESKIIPLWVNMEWSFLVQMLEYASHPLDSKASVRWLLSAGLTCKAFLGPALKALYRCPPTLPIISMSMAHKFAHLMRQLAAEPAAALAREDHRRTMIESLSIDVTLLTNTSYHGRTFDAAELIQFLPKLSNLELYHQGDLPPYRQLDKKFKKWLYSADLLEALRLVGEPEAGARLKFWKWSERLMDHSIIPPQNLKIIHEYKTFSLLHKICFVNFQVPSLRENKDATDPLVFEEDKAYINTIAQSLAPLEKLRHLVMESSTVVDGQFLSLLPKTVQHLEIVNCWELTAENLSQYLETHGKELRQLTLHHNQSLSLAFLPDLGRCCPVLREVRMDLTYYNHHEYYRDSNPIYDTLLTLDDVPTWPQTIQVIELEQLSRWTPEVAEMFFQSFVDNAPRMPMLRYLGIKAMLDVPWRQRCEFRDKWVPLLRKIFMRKTTWPLPYHSLSQWPLLKAAELGTKEQTDVGVSEEEVSARRSTRIATARVASPDPPSPATSESHEDRKRKRTGAISRELRKSKRVSNYREPDTDEDLDDLEENEAESEESPLSTPPDSPLPYDNMPYHGMCKVVNIRFDNQKPREFQWGVEDFLDSEEVDSEDEEWNSDLERGDDVDSDGYAW